MLDKKPNKDTLRIEEGWRDALDVVKIALDDSIQSKKDKRYSVTGPGSKVSVEAEGFGKGSSKVQRRGSKMSPCV